MVSKKKVAACVIILTKLKKEKKKRTVWVREWILRREELGAYSHLMRERSVEDPVQFSNFVGMKLVDFEYIVEEITPFIIRQDTKFRRAISVGERLAVTLRFLASGKKPYLKVNNNIFFIQKYKL